MVIEIAYDGPTSVCLFPHFILSNLMQLGWKRSLGRGEKALVCQYMAIRLGGYLVMGVKLELFCLTRVPFIRVHVLRAICNSKILPTLV
jgi:hypothetical protein